tara:strand:+ start:248 stop:499 length:252 start_codon:yes stop_codon:yes gene_type:complete
MCICVNCHWVNRCKTYHSVEKQHGVKHLTSNPDFQGNNPLIHIIVKEQKNAATSIEWDVRKCESFLEEQGKWKKLRPDEELPS